MINYLVNFQNSYVFAHLFEHNLVDLINKGVVCEHLFKSNILHMTFDYDEWPPTHRDTRSMLAGFNESIFRLRPAYKDVFPNIYNEDQKRMKKSSYDKHERVFKTQFHLNMITAMHECHGDTLMGAIANS